MSGVRIAYDPTLPVVASKEFTTGDHTFRDGDPVLWRDIGLAEYELLALWRCGLVHFLAADAPAIVAPAPAPQRKRAAR